MSSESVAERAGCAGKLASWSSTVDLLAVVEERQLVMYRLNWQRLWSRSCDEDVRPPLLTKSSARTLLRTPFTRPR
jgi:Anaphase-promoting complex subunit 4 WD40 domain